MNSKNGKLRTAGFAALTALAVGGVVALPTPAQAQRDRGSWRYNETRGSRESLRRLVDRAESTSNSFREAFERYERDRQSYDDDRYGRYDRNDRNDRYGRYDRDDRYSRDDRYNRDDRYSRSDRYRDNDRYSRNERYNGGTSFSSLKQVVQRMDEGLERLRSEVGNDNRYGSDRSLAAQVMSDARIIDSSMRRGRGGPSEMFSLWSRLRGDLNALATAYGVQRI